MGTRAEREIDDWLRNGGLVLASSDRGARALQQAYHHRRRTEGLTAWLVPEIHSWSSFTRNLWDDSATDNQILLNPSQEQALWAEIIGREEHLATVLEGPRHRLANLAMQAHDLLCSYLPQNLDPRERAGWDRDTGAFSRWLSTFSRKCRDDNFLSTSRVPLDLITALRNNRASRSPLLIIGFDRIQPIQRELFNAWGHWRKLSSGMLAGQVRFYATNDDKTELAACAAWCDRRLAENPQTHLLVISRHIVLQRGEMERAFLQSASAGDSPLFEFSLGVPLSQAPLPRAAYFVLRWLDGTLREHELDWLLSTGLTCSDQIESAALQSYMRSLRRRSLARTDWTLEAFASQSAVFEGALGPWYRRMNAARQRLSNLLTRRLSPFEWARTVPQLLDSADLPGERHLTSAEYQAWRRWEQTLDTCGTLGFDGRRIAWSGFLNALSRVLDETLYAPESSDAPIQIAGPAESAGLMADAIWFLGADEENWPATGSTHPFLPLNIQRQADMPHATARGDWDLAQTITTRLMESAPDLLFSYAKKRAGTDARPSRLVTQLTGSPQPLPSELVPPSFSPSIATTFSDTTRVPLSSEIVQGGSSILTAQSQCPFKAFAITRLAAQGWEPAEFGLTPSQRGQLLHAVLHSIWAGPPNGLRSHADLLAVTEPGALVESHAKKVLVEELPSATLERLPKRYLDLEGQRLIRVVTHWLEYEATRLPFTVSETEVDRPINVAGLTLRLRLDRIDRLNDDSPLVIDYKTGDVARKAWELPRPDDVQLPLYAAFALEEPPGGLLFAKVRPGEARFVGHVRTASDNLFPALKSNHPLERQKLTDDRMQAWTDYIVQLARDFIGGRADVDPREYPATCDRCDLHAICRIRENQALLNIDAEDAECDDE